MLTSTFTGTFEICNYTLLVYNVIANTLPLQYKERSLVLEENQAERNSTLCDHYLAVLMVTNSRHGHQVAPPI